MMKILLIILGLIACISLQAEWRDDWANAVKMCQEKKYEEAEEKFTKCINEIENKKDEKGAYVYVDRARLFLLLQRYEDALLDLNKALSNPNLQKKELTRALVSRICAKSNLGITEGVLEDLSAFRDSLPFSPEIEFTKEHIIIRNVPDSECFRDIMGNFLVKAGYCKSINDVKMLESGHWIIQRNDECKRECLENVNSQ